MLPRPIAAPAVVTTTPQPEVNLDLAFLSFTCPYGAVPWAVVPVSTLIIDQDEVRQWLPMTECIEVMEAALRTLARGDAVQPLRQAMWQRSRTGLLGLMPGYLGAADDRPRAGSDALGIKVVSIFPGNHGTALDSHQGVVLLFDTGNGSLQAIMDATEITAIRTAAVSAVATRRLARVDASVLAILGSGTQARTHLEATALVRTLAEVRIWSRNADAADRLARAADAPARVACSAAEAVAGADIICTTTAAREPVLHGAWIAPGAHVNAVGACFKDARELDTEAVRGGRVFVDRLESAWNEAGDLIIPRAEGAIDDEHVVGELGSVLTGDTPGRLDDASVTIFKSLGLAIEDLAAARHIYDRAIADQATRTLTIGGQRIGAS